MLPMFPLFLVIYELVIYLSNDMYLPALPHLATNLHTTIYLAQLTVTTCFLGTAFMQLFLGPISDRYGRRPVLLLGGLTFIISTFICALAPNIIILLVARFFQGCTVGTLMVSGYAAIHEKYDQRQAMQILAVMGGITILAPAFGPVLGGLLLNFITWRGIFWALIICSSIALLALYQYMPETLSPERRHSFSMKSVLGCYHNIITNKKFLLTMLAFCPLFAAMVTWITAGPFLVIETFHGNSFQFGTLQLIVFSGFIIGSQVIKKLIPTFNSNHLANSGLALTLLSAVLATSFTFFHPEYLSLFIITLVGLTLGSASVFPILQRLAIEASDEPMGSSMAVFSSIMGISMGTGSLLASISYTGTSFSIAIVIAGLVILACLANLFRSK